jgi:hypothetical protein
MLVARRLAHRLFDTAAASFATRAPGLPTRPGHQT